MWVLRTELNCSGLAASVLTGWAISATWLPYFYARFLQSIGSFEETSLRKPIKQKSHCVMTDWKQKASLPVSADSLASSFRVPPHSPWRGARSFQNGLEWKDFWFLWLTMENDVDSERGRHRRSEGTFTLEALSEVSTWEYYLMNPSMSYI